MITIKTGAYTDEEKRQLAILFDKFEKLTLVLLCPCEGKCTVCPYKHICEDIHQANVFIHNRAKL